MTIQRIKRLAAVNPKHQKLAVIRLSPPHPTGIIVHALHKSGSMFLYQLLFRLCRSRGIRFYSPNHPLSDYDQVTPSIAHDFCWGPIRDFEMPFKFSNQQSLRRIFHVRDPRDLLVSQYFSYGWRHNDEQFNGEQFVQRQRIQAMSVDEYVLDERFAIRGLKTRLAPLLERLSAGSEASSIQNAIVVVRYEQMVSDFSGWLDSILPAFSFRFPKLAKARFSFRYRNEFRPDENSSGHKRSVKPGDHLRQLKPATVEKLNRLLTRELELLGYSNNYRNVQRVA